MEYLYLVLLVCSASPHAPAKDNEDNRSSKACRSGKLAGAVTDRFILVTIVFILANCILPEHATGLWLNRWFSVFQ
jgi:hypothetical protein